MTIQQYLNNKDLFEVIKSDYDAYVKRFRNRELEDFTIDIDNNVVLYYKNDKELGAPVFGMTEDTSNEIPHHKFYVFTMLDDSLLADPIPQKRIELNEEDWDKFVSILMSKIPEDKKNG